MASGHQNEHFTMPQALDSSWILRGSIRSEVTDTADERPVTSIKNLRFFFGVGSLLSQPQIIATYHEKGAEGGVVR